MNMKENKFKILLLYSKMIPSILLCGHEQFKYLDRNNEIEYRAVNVYKITANDINWSNVVVLGRLDSWYEKELAEMAHKAKKYLIYIIDDDLLNLPKKIRSALHYNQKSIRDNINRMLEISDAIISPSPLLLDKYGENKVKIQVEEPIVYPSKYVIHKTEEAVKIGFAGSIDRTADLENVLYEALKEIKNKYKDKVQLEFFGAIPSFSKELNANCFAYSDSYDGYISKLNSLNWDIGLAPLPDSDFHKCKHYIKILEYAGVGIYPIYSNQGPYLRFNKQYDIGTMVSNDKDDWIKAIEQLINNKSLLDNNRQSLNEKICDLFSLEECSKSLKKQLDEKVVLCSFNNNILVNFTLLKTKGLLIKGFSKINRVLNTAKNKINQAFKRIVKKIKPELIIKNSNYFNDDWYSKNYNVKKEKACSHYLNKGYKKSYNPSNDFNGILYKKENPEIKDMNPLLHYEVYGFYEGRSIKAFNKLDSHIEDIDLNAFFSAFESLNAKIYAKPKGKSNKPVLVMSHEMDLSGAPIALYNIVLYLKNNGYMPIIISPKDGLLSEKAIENNVPVIIYKNLFSDNVLDYFYSLFDFMFINTLIFAEFINRLNGTNIKVIWWLHESLVAYKMFSEKVKTLPDTLSNNIHIYAVGDYAKQRMLEFRPKYNIDNLFYFLPDNDNLNNNIRFGFEDDKKTIFAMVGTIEPRKGYDILLDSLEYINKEYQNSIKVILVGRKANDDIFHKINNYKGPIEVKYIEKIDRDLMPSFYKKIDCLICASTDDPMPIVVTEAWKNSVPVICSESAGSAMLIKKYGGGYIYKNNNPKELGNAINGFILKNDAQNIKIKEGIEIYNNYFSEKSFNMHFDEIVKEIDKKSDLNNIKTDKKITIMIDEIRSKNGLFIRGWATNSKGDAADSIIVKRNNVIIEGKVSRVARNDVTSSLFNKAIDENLVGFEIEMDNTNSCALFFGFGQQVKKKNITVLTRIRKEYISKVINKLRRKKIKYEEWYRLTKPTKKDLLIQSQEEFDVDSPKFSILVPLFNTPLNFLDEMIESVLSQTYKNWELCLVDGSDKKHIDKISKEVIKYANKDLRIKYKVLENNLGISDNTNKAIEMASGDFIVLFDHDDLLREDALYEFAKAIQKNNLIDCIYSDEDKIDENSKHLFEPHFKPDFNMSLLCSNNYICHLFGARKTLVDKYGGFRKEYDGSQDHDFILRMCENARAVAHVPKILYHWRVHNNSTAQDPKNKMYCFTSGQKAVKAHYKRVWPHLKIDNVENGCSLGIYHTIWYFDDYPLVSVVIPNKDHIDDLDKAIRSMIEIGTWPNLEFIVVENNSEEERTFNYYKDIQKEFNNLKVVYYEGEFNYSKITNYGVKRANGEYLLLMNNDVELIEKDSIKEMMGYCQREDVGIVGCRLMYPNNTIQHGGVVVGIAGVAGHAFRGLRANETYFNRALQVQEYSAVTAAVLLTKRSVYDSVNGFDEDFKVVFNDVDYCLKVRQKGKLVIYNPYACFYHHESKSRGIEDNPEKIKRFNHEIALFVNRYNDFLNKGDEYYNQNLTLWNEDWSLKNPRLERIGEQFYSKEQIKDILKNL